MRCTSARMYGAMLGASAFPDLSKFDYIEVMANRELIEQIKQLPPEAQQEAADFVDYLSNKYLQKDAFTSKKSILNSPFRGMWKDRQDMKDSTKWGSNIRKSRFAK